MLVEMNISSCNSVKYAEQLRTGKTAEQNDEAHGSRIMSKDEYIGSESPVSEPIGLYRQGRDENGDPKIFFDDPQKAEDKDKDNKNVPERSEEKDVPEEDPDVPEKQKEKCTANTDEPDREIKRLKEKKQQLEQQLRSACGNESKVRELERKLAQTEYELSEKDNDTYRRQHTKFS